jgi:tyrosyl-tRNA synthetase
VDQKEAFALTFPLIVTATGAKMGKTAAGAVWLSAELTSAFDFYQYFINIDDRDVGKFLKLFTFLPMAEILRLEALEGAELRAAKQVLAFEVTRLLHGEAAAQAAQQSAQAAFSGGGAGDANVPSHELTAAELAAGVKVVDLLAACGLAASRARPGGWWSRAGCGWGTARWGPWTIS